MTFLHPAYKEGSYPHLPCNHEFLEVTKSMSSGSNLALTYEPCVSGNVPYSFEPRFSVCRQHCYENAIAKIMLVEKSSTVSGIL